MTAGGVEKGLAARPVDLGDRERPKSPSRATESISRSRPAAGVPGVGLTPLRWATMARTRGPIRGMSRHRTVDVGVFDGVRSMGVEDGETRRAIAVRRPVPERLKNRASTGRSVFRPTIIIVRGELGILAGGPGSGTAPSHPFLQQDPAVLGAVHVDPRGAGRGGERVQCPHRRPALPGGPQFTPVCGPAPAGRPSRGSPRRRIGEDGAAPWLDGNGACRAPASRRIWCSSRSSRGGLARNSFGMA